MPPLGNAPVGSGAVGIGPVGRVPVGSGRVGSGSMGTAGGTATVGAAVTSATGRDPRMVAGTSNAPAAAVAATRSSRKTPGIVSRPLGRRAQARVARAAVTAA